MDDQPFLPSPNDFDAFTKKTHAEMSAWEDRDEDLATSDSTALCYVAIVALALLLGGVAYWLGWARV